MNLTYTVDSNSFLVQIYMEGSSQAIIYQPDWPDGTPWSSKEEAEIWAQLCIQAIVDDSAPYAPSGPGLSGEPKNR